MSAIVASLIRNDVIGMVIGSAACGWVKISGSKMSKWTISGTAGISAAGALTGEETAGTPMESLSTDGDRTSGATLTAAPKPMSFSPASRRRAVALTWTT